MAAKAESDRAIRDADKAKLVTLLTYEAERFGGPLLRVDARKTSQDCSGRGTRAAKPPANQTHRCPACGVTLDYDWSAARTILTFGLV